MLLRTKNSKNEKGMVLIATLLFMAVLSALIGAYYSVSSIEFASMRHANNSVSGFYAAEAGLNVRAEEIRDTFVGYNRPAGTSPTPTSEPCISGNNGSGDFACQTYDLNKHMAITYINEDPDNPVITTIPPGELYQNLSAQEYRYTANSVSENNFHDREALLQLRFKSRLVPLFQFAAFYNKDLEILPGPAMTLSGPVHTNGDLYLNSEASLAISGQVTTAGELYRGRKNTSGCNSTQVTVRNPTNPLALKPTCTSRIRITDTDIVPYNGMIARDVDVLTVPEPDSFAANQGAIYWDRADLRIVLALNSSGVPIGVQARNANDTVDSAKTTNLTACAGSISGRAVNHSNTFYNNREAKTIRMLEIDMRALLNCVHNHNLFGAGKTLADDSDGGVVLHVTVKGPNSGINANNYGIRIRNADTLRASVGGAPLVKGISVVSDQAVYTHGHYNRTNKIPAAIMVDSINFLSTNWNLNDAASTNVNTSARVATATTINAALLSGTDSTGNTEGAGGQGGAYNGGLENYPRLHENWSGQTLTYRGSFVSLGRPLHVRGAWVYGNPQYEAPTRNWDYDTAFNDAANLPPLTPRFVYLRQELFVRDYEQ